MNPESSLPDHLPHGIRELVAYPSFWSEERIWIALGLVFFAIILFLIYFFWRRQKPSVVESLPVDPLARLLDELKSMAPPSPFEGKAVQDYFFLLSGKFRQLIELSTKIDATNLTNKELKKPFRDRLPVSRTEVEEILQLLDRCELIQFAEAFVSQEEAGLLSGQVREWAQILVPRHIELGTGSGRES